MPNDDRSRYADIILAAKPRGYWRLGNVGATAIDQAGDELNGSYLGSPLPPPVASLIVGTSNRARDFDPAATQRVDIGDVLRFPGVAPFSLEAWIRPDDTVPSTFPRIISKEIAANNGYALGWARATERAFFVRGDAGGSSSILTVTGDCPDGQIRHVVGTFDGQFSRVYVDGILAAGPTDTSSRSLVDSAATLRIATRSGAGDAFKGTIDEVAIYDFALTAAQVARHHDVGISLYAPPQPAEVRIRSPYAPHEPVAVVPVASLSYGPLLMEPSTASFAVRRDDPAFAAAASHLHVGAMISIESGMDNEGAPTWAGFVTKRYSSIDAPVVQFEAHDHAGALYAHARTAIWPTERVSDAATHLRQLFDESNGRASPPLLTRLDLAHGGPAVRHEARADSILDMLTSLSETTGWEWMLTYDVGVGGPGGLQARLVWRERVGRDLRDAVVLEQGRDFVSATYTQDARGFAAAALVIGGEGAFHARPSAEHTEQAAGLPVPVGVPATNILIGSIGRRIGRSVPKTPTLDTARVTIEPTDAGGEALEAAANRLLHASPWIGESLSLVVEERAVAGVLPGDFITVRFSEIDLGLGLVRVVRVRGLAVTYGSGTIELETQIVDA